MSMKDFWKEQVLLIRTKKCVRFKCNDPVGESYINGFIDEFNRLRKAEGIFLWNRRGKQFAKGFSKIKGYDIRDMIFIAKDSLENNLIKYNTNNTISFYLQAQDFLDCLACLGKEEVEKLIKELN